MIAMALVAMALGAGEPVSMWWDAYEIGSKGIDLPQGGTYHIWAWAPGNETSEMTVAGKSLEVKKKGKRESGHLWLRAGELALKEIGPHSKDEEIVAVVETDM